MDNEIGRLFKVIIYIKGTDTYLFIHRHKVSQDIKVTYNLIVCNIRPQKKETHRVKLTVSSNKLTYDVPVSTPTSDLTRAKIHWNSVLSTPDEKYLIVAVKNFYLKNPTKNPEYYKIEIKITPQYIIEKYDLNNNQSDGYIYVRAEKGMYVLVQ